MTHDALSLDDIASLLKDNSLRPKPKQVGPLNYDEVYLPCTMCGAACMVRVNDKPYCTSHALYALNRLLIEDRHANNCTCVAGHKTMFNVHTSDCAAYEITDYDYDR